MEVSILLVSILGKYMSALDFMTLYFYITLTFTVHKGIKKLTNELLRSKKSIR